MAGGGALFISGHVYCTAIEGCQEISDFGRVAEWTAALERWCSAQPGLLLLTGQRALPRGPLSAPGRGALRGGRLFRMRGDWAEALDELELAAQRYVEAGSPDAIGLTSRESGDVLRPRGAPGEADGAHQRPAP